MNLEAVIKALKVFIAAFRPQSPMQTPVKQHETLLWDTPKEAWHSTRVLCDNAGLTYAQKNILCACIYQESNFWNYRPDGHPVSNRNIRQDGSLGSTDWGICQVNDRFHVGPGLDFPSVDYVLSNPGACVKWMVDYYARHGHLNAWVSYSSGAYKQWLPTSSPMWKLAGQIIIN